MIRVSWLVAGTPTPHPAGLVRLAPDLARFRRLKQRSPLLRVCGRIAVSGAPPRIARSLVYRVYSVMRVLDGPGAALVRRTLPWRVVAARVRERSIPLVFWPAVLNTRELAGLLGFPIDNVQAPGISLNTARQLAPPPEASRGKLVLAYSNYPGMENRPLGLSREDRLRHVWLLGPTGTGKSTRLADLAVQTARTGDGFLVIDPKADLCEEIAGRLPQDRLDDVMVLNPASTNQPVGFNVLQAARDESSRELVVDNVVRIFAEIWKASFGPRTTDVLRNALLTLTATRAPDGSAFTLVEVPPLLEQPRFRRYVTVQPTVPEPVRSFCVAYEAMSVAQRGQLIGPSLNKLRALTTCTSLRLMLGQSAGIDVGDVLTKRRILLVSLNKGLIGGDGAALLGSFVVALLWQAALRRSNLPALAPRPAWAFLDEFQDVLRLSDDVPDALSQARGLGLGFVLAHQYLGQLPPALQAAVLGTVRSWMILQPDYDDAKALERRFSPLLTADDLMNLRAHEVAMRLCLGGQTYPPVTGRTLPLGEPTSDPFAVVRASRERFGTTRSVVEATLRARLEVRRNR
jgi:type IV secretion system coupling TraD/TrwB family protein